MRFLAMAAFAVATVFAVSLGAWAQSNSGYTDEMRAQLETSCTSGGGDPLHCRCVWNGIRAEYTLAQYHELSAAYGAQQLHPLMERQELIVAYCKGDLPTAGRYPNYTVSNFVTGCERSGVSSAICNCIVSGLQTRVSFKDFVELDLMSAWGRNTEHPAHAHLVQVAQQCVAANQ